MRVHSLWMNWPGGDNESPMRFLLRQPKPFRGGGRWVCRLWKRAKGGDRSAPIQLVIELTSFLRLRKKEKTQQIGGPGGGGKRLRKPPSSTLLLST